jgi:hypothetical protein
VMFPLQQPKAEWFLWSLSFWPFPYCHQQNGHTLEFNPALSLAESANGDEVRLPRSWTESHPFCNYCAW